MTLHEMAARFDAYDSETLAFIFGDWINLSTPERDARQATIDVKHNYKHGWIIVSSATGIESFDRCAAFPHEVFANVWD